MICRYALFRGSIPVSNFSSNNGFREPQEGTQVKARVKWFNPDKGFGFVAPVDGTPDAFVHVSSVQRVGMTQLPDGAEILCEIGPGPKGPQVIRILDVTAAEPELPSAEPLGWSVKWFASEKGFGFIAADDGGKDVFIHKSVLRRCGVGDLFEGQRVRVVAEPTAKGREANWIALG